MENKKSFKYKFIKYLNKNMKGGMIVPQVVPITQSWLYMPILLKPFKNIRVVFPKEFDEALNEVYDNFIQNLQEIDPLPNFSEVNANRVKNLEEMIKTIENYYINNKIDLNDYNNLTNLRVSGGPQIVFDEDMHIPGEQQEQICNAANNMFTHIMSNFVIPTLIRKFGGNWFEFIKFNRFMFGQKNIVIQKNNTNLCLDDYRIFDDKSTEHEKRMQLWECFGHQGQRFDIEYVNNHYAIKKAKSNTCIEKMGDGYVYSVCDLNKNEQLFDILKSNNGSAVIKNSTGQCMSTYNNNNGEIIRDYNCDDKLNNENQMFNFNNF